MLGHTKFESNNILMSFKTFFLQGGEVFSFLLIEVAVRGRSWGQMMFRLHHPLLSGSYATKDKMHFPLLKHFDHFLLLHNSLTAGAVNLKTGRLIVHIAKGNSTQI